jgi:hypothetical protein
MAEGCPRCGLGIHSSNQFNPGISSHLNSKAKGFPVHWKCATKAERSADRRRFPNSHHFATPGADGL